MSAVTSSHGDHFASWQFKALAGLLDVLDRRQASRGEAISHVRTTAADVFRDARIVFANDAAEDSLRLAAARLLGRERAQQDDDVALLATRAFVGEGQRLRLPYPSYILYKSLAQIQGARSEEVHFARDWSLGDDFAAGRRFAAGVFAQSQ